METIFPKLYSEKQATCLAAPYPPSQSPGITGAGGRGWNPRNSSLHGVRSGEYRSTAMNKMGSLPTLTGFTI